MSQADPLVSVIILNFNGKDCLTSCLDSVLKNQYNNFEVIVVDNASTDQALQTAEELFGADSRLRIIRNGTNLGFSGGNNVGFAHSHGDYIVFLNNDTIVAPDWLTTLVSIMQNDSTIGLAQSLILTIDGQRIQTAGWLFSNYLIHKCTLCADKPSNMQLLPVFEVSFVCGACMMVRREIVEVMGLFDPKIPFFYDDTLLSLKTRLAQKRVVTVSGSKIRHAGGATNVWKTKFTTYHLLKSNLCLLFDIYPRLTDLARALLVNAFHITSNTFFCVKKKNIAAIVGNISALVWSIKNLGHLWQNRLDHWSKTAISPENLKKAFVKINLPTALYLLPSKLCNDSLSFAVSKYENMILKD
ncbi:MAG: glycosyltransferase family 2 protein [Candidatus Bathyarchaeota archaeon]|nr:glycosyltransferase family 2 protein [Candidatus Bathyarchaeota archaeon]